MNTPVKNQHVLPAKSIERFYDNVSNTVDVYRIKENRFHKANSNNNCFVAERKWDEQIEKVAVGIETAFQKLALELCSGLESLNADQTRLINKFYALISQRSIAKSHIFDDTGSPFTDNSPEHSQHDIDIFESDGIFLGGPDQMERAVRGIAQRMALAQTSRVEASWGVLRCEASSEFIVSDTYHQLRLVPVNPQTYLKQSAVSELLSEAAVCLFNKCVLESSTQFVFARTLNQLEFKA